MFIFTKFVAVTCGFCLGAAILLDIAILVAGHITGAVGVSFGLRQWLTLWGLVWLGSFFLAWRLLISPIVARAPRL